MALDANNTQIASSVLDASSVTFDRVFEEIINAITPNSISIPNKSLIEAFVDILAEVSPISVNIIDAFSKDIKAKNIENVQDGFAQMYLNNFYYVWKRAENDYILRTRLENLLERYKSTDNNSLFEDTVFFNDEKSLYTVERYILGKNFKEKKGTATAIEYAYKVGWLAGIEGPLKSDYHFNIIHEECTGGLTKGFYICNSLITPCSGLIGSGVSKLINTFKISDTVDATTCTPFTYRVEGNMIPELFDAFVIPLAHPVGFRYIYERVLSHIMEDYFNLEVIFTADEVNVYSLCPDSDCSEVKKTLMASSIDTGVSKSHLRTIERGRIYSGTYEGYEYNKYIFENNDYIIEYVYSDITIISERVIHYFDYSQMMENNIILNSSFDTIYFWDFLNNSSWYIDTTLHIASLENGQLNDYISYPIALEVGVEYLISIDVSDLVGRAQLDLGSWKTYDENGVEIVGVFDTAIYYLEDNLTYKFYYTARGGEYFRISASTAGTSLNIDNIILTPYIPTMSFAANTHSSIELIGLSLPKHILYTHDILDEFIVTNILTDDMNELYYNYSGELTPYIGDIIINDFYYGTSTYTLLDKVAIGDVEIVEVTRYDTIDYKVSEITINGTTNTIYQAISDLGTINLYLENFTDTNRWSVFLYDSDTGDPDDDVTNEGGFIIGNHVIPWGDPRTAYMYDDFESEIIGPPWTSNFVDNDFIDPSKWTLGSSWTMEIGSTPNLNKASAYIINETEINRTIYRSLDMLPDLGNFIKVTIGIYMIPESISQADAWIDIYIGDHDPHRYYDSGVKEIMLPYDGNNTIKMIASDGFEGNINNVLSVSCHTLGVQGHLLIDNTSYLLLDDSSSKLIL